MDEKLLEIINKILVFKDSEPIKEIVPELNLRRDLGLDSLDLAELTVRIEKEFGVDIFEEGLVETIGEIKLKLKANENIL